MIDTKKRSIIKTLTWRVIAVILLAVTSFLTTGDLRTASLITLIYHSIQLGMFFIHERVWNMVSWGRSSGLFIQMTGMSGAGKTTLARIVQQRLQKKGLQVEVIDGDEYRSNLCSDLGFSKEDRNTNIRRLGFVAKVLARNNVVSIISAINPYESVREELSGMDNNVKTVYVSCGLETLKKRDTKGLYRKALLPDGDPEKIHNFTGISDPFEEPTTADLIVNTEEEDIEASAHKLEEFIVRSVS
jgi:adenylylsulfate kinase